MADMIFNAFNQKLGAGVFDLSSDSLKLCLLTSAYTPDATDAVYGDLSGEVANGNGYTTGGKALTGVTWTQDGNGAVLDAADPSWTSATFTARYAVLYDDTDANKSLICLFDFGGNVAVTAGTFTVSFDAAGMLVLDVAA
jgi:hypothetical protein